MLKANGLKDRNKQTEEEKERLLKTFKSLRRMKKEKPEGLQILRKLRGYSD
jgi:hypothetical protein